MTTETVNPHTLEIDQASTLDMLRMMNDEDATVAGVVRNVLPAVAVVVDAVVGQLKRGGRLIYVGAGTSGRLAMLDAVECVPTFGTPPTLVQTLLAGGPAAMTAGIEGAEDDTGAAQEAIRTLGTGPADIVIGVAASGRTPFVLSALTEAKSCGAVAAAISCNTPAPILECADYAVVLETGPEVIAGSTRLKAGTAQKLVLNMISTATMIQMGKVYGNRMVDLRVTNAKLRTRAIDVIRDVLGLPFAEAERLLLDSGLEVKRALLMGMFELDRNAATRALQANEGRLRDAIEVLRAK